jgi:hypothetical protein
MACIFLQVCHGDGSDVGNRFLKNELTLALRPNKSVCFNEGHFMAYLLFSPNFSLFGMRQGEHLGNIIFY